MMWFLIIQTSHLVSPSNATEVFPCLIIIHIKINAKKSTTDLNFEVHEKKWEDFVI